MQGDRRRRDLERAEARKTARHAAGQRNERGCEEGNPPARRHGQDQPNRLRACGLMRSGVQDGSQTRSTRTSVPSAASMRIGGRGLIDQVGPHRARGRGHGHLHQHPSRLRDDCVHQAEVDDVHPRLGILDAPQGLAHVGLGHVVTSVEAPRSRLDVRQTDGLQKV